MECFEVGFRGKLENSCAWILIRLFFYRDDFMTNRKLSSHWDNGDDEDEEDDGNRPATDDDDDMDD